MFLDASPPERDIITMAPEDQEARGSVNDQNEKQDIMGDKSPKAVNKHATQKQNKANSALEKKKQAITAKQGAGKRD